jgi:hypothetical protein
LADLTFYLPPVPGFPSPAIPCPVSIGRQGGQLIGLFGRSQQVSISLPWSGTDATFQVEIERPTARSVTDLLPTAVQLDAPVGRHPVELPGVGGITLRAAEGHQLNLRGTISTSESGAAFEASLDGEGSERGIALIAGRDEAGLTLALIGALGPFLGVPSGTFAALTKATAEFQQISPAADAQTMIQAVRISAVWTGDTPGELRVRVDYESQVGMGVSDSDTGLEVRTIPGHPVRLRHRDAAVHLTGAPRLSWREATTTLVSTGDWEVVGPLAPLLRIVGVRPRGDPLTIELDVGLELELGLVTVDQAVIRLTVGGSRRGVSLSAFGVAVDVPGAIAGRGELEFHPEGGFGAALDVSLPTVGAAGKGVVVVWRDLTVVGIQASLFAPIPFANTGLGLYGLSGLIASGAQRNLPGRPGGDPIERELDWDRMDPSGWVPGTQDFVGLGGQVGTVPDLGFALMADASMLFALPDPMLRIALDARLLRGAASRLFGVIVLEPAALTIALRGRYDIDHLLSVDVPAGATFPFDRPGAWSVRLGGDRDEGRGEPVTLHVLPDLLDLEAWGFLMAFGNAETTAGEVLAPPGLPLDGLSLAFGAGVEVRWAAGPFLFDAGGTVLATVTHLPARHGSDQRPWVLAGRAAIHGAVDLGPMSVAAHADLEAIVAPADRVFYGRARACATVDLWLVTLEGCVRLEVGDKPSDDIPTPESPLLKVVLTDRLGTVVGEALEGAGTPTTVWPDTVPVLAFSHWVAQAPLLPGLARTVGDSVPLGGGWVGTRQLSYRFELLSVRSYELGPTGAETEVGSGWTGAWQLPLSASVYGTTSAAPEARTLALNHVDPHHWLQPASHAGAGAPGDPLGVLGGLCLPSRGPGVTWFLGQDARLPVNGPMVLPPGARPKSLEDFDAIEVTVGHPRGDLPVDERLDAIDQVEWYGYTGPFVEARTQLQLDGVTVRGACWLPRFLLYYDVGADVSLRLSRPALDVVVHLLVPAGHDVTVRDDGNVPWAQQRGGLWGDMPIQTWTAPEGQAIDRFRINAGRDRVAIVAVAARSAVAVDRAMANDEARRNTHDLLQAAADSDVGRRSMLKPGTPYRVDVDVGWSGRRDEYDQQRSGSFATRTFRFRTAPRRPSAGRAPSLVPAVGPLTWPALITASVVAQRRFEESELADADLRRYVGGVVPPDGTTEHFCDDPVQVLFVVDHVADLAAAYGSSISVVVRRTDAATDGNNGHALVTAVPVLRPSDAPVIPLSVSHLTPLDQARAALFIERAGSPDACMFPLPGRAVQPSSRLEASATYALSVTLERNTTGARPPPKVGSGSVIHETDFRTSRYRDADGLLTDLGLQTAGRDHLHAFGITIEDSRAHAELRSPGTRVGEGFQAALDVFGLGGYDAPTNGRTSVLWHSVGASWQVIGVLLESPEAIERPGRLALSAIRLSGAPVGALHWDARRTRLLALLSEPIRSSAPIDLSVSVAETRGSGNVVTTSYRSAIGPPPMLSGALA